MQILFPSNVCNVYNVLLFMSGRGGTEILGATILQLQLNEGKMYNFKGF